MAARASATPNFEIQLTTIPYTPAGGSSKGTIGPILRASGHILYALGAVADENHPLTPEEVTTELTHASEHLASPNYVAEVPLSAGTKNLLSNFLTLVELAKSENPNWTPEARLENLKHLANRATAIASSLDRETLGIRDAHPGSSL